MGYAFTDVRAVTDGVLTPAPKGGYASNLVVDGTTFTATFVFDDPKAARTAAGTGIVLTSNGTVLTNNHVVRGATSIKVTDVGNGRTYTAKVVGYDATKDVAVIQLRRNKPDVERTWKPPFNVRVFGFSVPITAVLGGLGTFIAWLVVMALNPRTLVVGLGWMGIGVFIMAKMVSFEI